MAASVPPADEGQRESGAEELYDFRVFACQEIGRWTILWLKCGGST